MYLVKTMNLKAKFMDFEAGLPFVVMNILDAKELGVYVNDRVTLSHGKIKKTAYIETTKHLVKTGEIGIRKESVKYGIRKGTLIKVVPSKRPASVEIIRKKLKGHELKKAEIETLVSEINANRLSDIELGVFVSSVYIRKLSQKEILYLTRAMISCGKCLEWGNNIVVDKHSIGGVPGNRVTPIVVAIVAACGVLMPKTSSRAITSPAGTSDTMEVFCDVSFSSKEVKRIVKKTGACIVWGGSLDLAPVDDKLIRIEHPLSIDPEGQVLASVMSKKKSVGSKYVVIDIPYGDGSKEGDIAGAEEIAKKFKWLARQLDMRAECTITRGDQPIGFGVGPVAEAIDIIDVFDGKGPDDLREKSLELAGILLKMTKKGDMKTAKDILDSGKAKAKFYEIVKAQNGVPGKDVRKLLGKHRKRFFASRPGYVVRLDNRAVARTAKFAGAPKDIGAGIILRAKKGDKVSKGDLLFEIYAEQKYKLAEAEKYARKESLFFVGAKNVMVVEKL